MNLLLAAPVLLVGLFAVQTARASEITVVSGLTQLEELAPGEQVSGEIRVRNLTDEPVPVILDPRDYRHDADGTSAFLEPGTLERSNADWIEIQPRQRVLAPGETVPFRYTMSVPENLADEGTFWSLVMVSPRVDHRDGSGQGDKVEVGISNRFQHAIQMVTQVGEADKQLVFGQPDLKATAEGTTLLRVTLANEGGALASPRVWADVFTEGGGSVGRFETKPSRIYPGSARGFLLDLGELPKGRYTALVVGDAGGDEAFGAQYTLDIE